ncbi:MAG TPA: hypothetical protein DCS43_00945 [Verrucomicrobia bacterium]|nr:hypothetical protein [Verrucomicrobiota bacterium]
MKAAIFDLDGTLMDTEILWVKGTWQYLQQHGCALTYDELLGIVYGRSWRHVYSEIMQRCPSLGVTMPAMEVALRQQIHALRQAHGDIIIHSSVALLKRLAQDVPVCIVSGSPCADIADAVERMGIGPDLQFFIGAEEYGPGKPDPTCFLMAQERLGVAAKDCVVFEDSAAGVRAAKAAGMVCVGLARPGLPRQDLSPADWVVADLAALDPAALAR